MCVLVLACSSMFLGVLCITGRACVLRLSVLVIKDFQYSIRTYITYSCVNV
jgi:hypothetical protein